MSENYRRDLIWSRRKIREIVEASSGSVIFFSVDTVNTCLISSELQ